MSDIDGLLMALDQRTITQKVELAHDQARAQYPLRANTVDGFDEFAQVIGNYYSYHFEKCVCPGATLPQIEARARAKELLERQYANQGGSLVSAYNDAHDGTHGGMRVLLDIIAENLKAESVERYTREMFDRYVAPHDHRRKVEIIRQFFAACADHLSGCDLEDPGRYATKYEDLIRAYVSGLRRLASLYRNL